MTIDARKRYRNLASAMLIAVPSLLVAGEALAEDYNATAFMRDYDADQRALVLGGMIDGLAQARYERDGKDPTGAKCIYDWFFGGEETLLKIYGAMAANGNSAPVAVVSALVNRKCGS